MRRALPFVLLVLLSAGTASAQSSIGGGAAAALEQIEAERARNRALEQRRIESEREHQLQLRALELQRQRATVSAQSRLSSMSYDDFRATGLYRLSPTEIAALAAWMDGHAAAPSRPVANGPMSDESRIDGDFEGFEYGRIFKLVNGEVWEQISSRYHYKYAYSPRVRFYRRTGITSYFMLVDGIDEPVAVSRIK